MRAAALFAMILASASTVTFAAPLPASISARPSAPVLASTSISDHIQPSGEVQDLHARWGFSDAWNSVKSAVGSAANTVKNVATGATDVYNSASGTIKAVSSAYNQVAPILGAMQKRDEEMEDHLHRRGDLGFEEELYRRDKMELERQLHRRDLVESTKVENEKDVPVTKVPTSRKAYRRTRFPHRHHD